MYRQRSGFSFVELMVAMVLVGAMLAIVGPKLGVFKDGNAVRSAKRRVSSMLLVAKQSAVRRGISTTFTVAGNTVSVTAAGGQTIAGPVNLQEVDNVVLTLGDVSDATITFDPRGLTTVSAQARKYVFSAGAKRDSVCVGGFGTIQARGCIQ